jgi:hypothetical protein
LSVLIRIDRAANAAGIDALGVTDDAGFVDVLPGKTDLIGGRSTVLFCNSAYPVAAVAFDLAALLCRIVFVGETPASKNAIPVRLTRRHSQWHDRRSAEATA